MPQAHSPIVERIARVLAGAELSVNAGGSDPSASSAVDERWRDHRGQALAILHALREPDADMVAAGDAGTWSAMVHAALQSANRADA